MGDDLDCASLSEHPVERGPFTTPVFSSNCLGLRKSVTGTVIRMLNVGKVPTGGTTLGWEVRCNRDRDGLVSRIGSCWR